MESSTRYPLIQALAVVGLAALVLRLPAARAQVVQAGGEPWHRQVPAEARQQAEALFAQAVDKHQLLLRGDAKVLYEQALALWDNPDIRWNLALVLEELGQYVHAHEQLESALRWGAALGPERLREIHDQMRALEMQRLARIETSHEEPGAVIKLDGQPWLRQAGRRSKQVVPGEHYIAVSKPGYFPVTRPVYVHAGQQARVALPMDEDRLIEVRRWTAWKPWAVIGAGIAVAAVGVELERRAFAHRDAATANALAGCAQLVCDSTPLDIYDRPDEEHRRAASVIAAGATSVAVGLALAWLNRPRAHRTRARPPSEIELTPILSPHQAELSAQVRF